MRVNEWADYPAGGDSGGWCALIIASPPERGHRNADGSAHVAPAEVALGLPTFIFEAVVTRRGNAGLGVPYIRPFGRALLPSAPSACTSTSYRMLHAGAHSGNRSDGRPPPGLFLENTNLEWMVLASRERKPPG
ncbi:hypothetical protein MSG28_002302 [Choristoneura fumiferana]|uniref:Uncharacterized protein n=1 Tax=Choristoneura fumiferana TaxID=7141 RepID=A0ACC0JV63_CHOFU|nr:hypothetical protein MSG28_002302 [Choristoneura fumiferana]